jgi:hypothetical protein
LVLVVQVQTLLKGPQQTTVQIQFLDQLQVLVEEEVAADGLQVLLVPLVDRQVVVVGPWQLQLRRVLLVKVVRVAQVQLPAVQIMSALLVVEAVQELLVLMPPPVPLEQVVLVLRLRSLAHPLLVAVAVEAVHTVLVLRLAVRVVAEMVAVHQVRQWLAQQILEAEAAAMVLLVPQLTMVQRVALES